MSLYRCAACGSPNVVTDTQAGGIKYNYLKGAIGTVALGVGGAAAGITNETQKVFKCPDCGITLTYSMPQDMKNLIDIGVMSSDARQNLKYGGVQIKWDYLLSKYKNIESGLGDRLAAMDAEEKRLKELRGVDLLKSKGNASKEEFDNAIDELIKFEHRLGRDRGKDDPLHEDEFTSNTPPSLADYIVFSSSVDTFIENYFKYLQIADDFDTKYRNVSSLRLFFKDYLGFYLYSKYYNSTVKLFSVGNLTEATTNFGEFIWADPFFFELLKIYSKHYNSQYVRLGLEKAFDDGDCRRIGSQVLGLFQDSFLIKEVNSAYVPILLYSDGALFYWDVSFFSSPLHLTLSKNLGEATINNYFSYYPDQKSVYDAEIEDYKKQVKKAQEEELQKKNNIGKIEAEIESNSRDISSLESKIREEESEIYKLSKKLFGKKKAAEEITYYKNSIDKKKEQIKQHRDKLKDMKNKLEESKETPIGTVESEREFNQRLREKWGYFIAWHRVEEGVSET